MVTQALYGLGGVGKTELALHYADTHRDRYCLIGWITADNPENISAGLAALAVRIHPEIGHATATVATDWALAWLQTHPGWLLVLDNVEDVKHVEPLLGQLNTGHILITSRRDNWQRLATAIKLEVLTSEAAIDLLLRETGETDRETAGEIATELGRLPLALEQAAAYIGETGIGGDRYLELLRERPARMYATAPGAGDAQRTVARVWDISLSVVAARNADAVRLLNVLAWYAPDDVPRTLIAPNEDRVDVDEALAALASYSMIDRTDDAVSVHRLVQSVLLSRQMDAAHDESVVRAPRWFGCSPPDQRIRDLASLDGRSGGPLFPMPRPSSSTTPIARSQCGSGCSSTKPLSSFRHRASTFRPWCTASGRWRLRRRRWGRSIRMWRSDWESRCYLQ